jgi:hypothetical protein
LLKSKIIVAYWLILNKIRKDDIPELKIEDIIKCVPLNRDKVKVSDAKLLTIYEGLAIKII